MARVTLVRTVIDMHTSKRGDSNVPKYVIERTIPGIGNSSAEELRNISQTSNNALQELGPSIQWVQSYVTDDTIYCIYIAPNPDMVMEHARIGGFPADRISEVRNLIDPTSGE